MVGKICDLKYIVVDTESDALLLENNLIKKYLPRYNVLLKDDKTYPWICIKNESFQRVFPTRNVRKDGSLYYGPYTSTTMIRTLLSFIKQLFQLRSCSLVLSNNNISSGKFKVCLEYHIGNCKGPCVGLQSELEYNITIDQIKSILKGNIQQVKSYLKEIMKEYADNYRFEQANEIKNKIEIIENFQSKSTIVNPSIHNVDVFSFVEDENVAVVNFLKIMDGCIIQSHTMEMVKRVEEEKTELLEMAIWDIRERFKSESKEILIPFEPEFNFPGVNMSVPQIGDKKKLIELSERNAQYYLNERNRNLESINPEARIERKLDTMKRDLGLKDRPVHIECFDNSNIQGTNPVASCVVFKNCIPCKREYRHFNIKTVVGPNDFASMEEIVFRRYRRVLDENLPLPQLIVIDGGKGQLHSAVNSLKKLEIFEKVIIIGIAKRLEEIYFPGDSIPIYLDKKSETLKVIQQIRDEAHRFGISFHRDKRSEAMINSRLKSIPGIGDKTIELLFSKYTSLSVIKKSEKSEIIELIGKKRAELLFEFFKSPN
jgi:excinuclease ABC subunit C